MTRHAVHITTDKTPLRNHTGGGQFLNYARDSYLERTSRPIYAIVFLLPFIVFYELGTLLINTDVLGRSQVRVVAFVWLQDLLGYLGYEGRLAWIAPPLVVIVILLGLQIASHKAWYFLVKDIGPMVCECILLAVPLIVLSLFLNSSMLPTDDPAAASLMMTGLQAAGGDYESSLLASVITGVGAGIYEELVFRLILISLLVMVLQDLLRLPAPTAIIMSVLISAALFSAHHHVIFTRDGLQLVESFDWLKFSFRTMAGVYFAGLFALRGFGITAGTHAFYDILATCLNGFFFQS